MKRLPIIIVLLSLYFIQHAEAQDLYPTSQCQGTGGYSSLAYLLTQIPPHNAPCANSWTPDAGFVVSDGTRWIPMGSGSVTSIGLSAPSIFSISGSPVTVSGTLGLSFAPGQTANSFLATPNGSSGAVSLRALVAADLPASITASTSGNAATATALAASPTQCSAGQFSTGVTVTGNANCGTGNPGTVTSVAVTVPTPFTATNCTITASGTCAISWSSGQSANQFLATPNGAAGAVALRSILSVDLPGTIAANTTGNAGTATALASTPTQCSGQFATGITASGNANCASQVAPPIGTPNSRALSLATAYQATTTAKAASVNVNITSTASISLSGGTTNSATVYIGSTNAVASGTGTPICSYSNSNTGTLTIGLNLSTISAVPCHFDLPAGWFFAILQSSGTVTITSAYDQSIG